MVRGEGRQRVKKERERELKQERVRGRKDGKKIIRERDKGETF